MAIDFQPQIDFQPEAPTSDGNSVLDTMKSVGKSVAGALSPELTTAAEAFNSPIGQKMQDLTSIPYQGIRGLTAGAAQVVPALRSGDPSQLPSPQAALQKASEATQADYKPETPIEKGADIAAQIIEPRALLAAELLKAAGPGIKSAAGELGKQAAKLQEVLTGVDDNNFRELFNAPGKILNAPSSKETGKAFQVAKEAAGLTAEDERSIATKEDFRKSIYNDTMKKIDAYLAKKPSPQEQIGREFLGPKAVAPPESKSAFEGLGADELAPIRPPNVEAYSKGTMGKGANKMTLWGVKGDPNEISKLGYGPDPASIPENVLRAKGIRLPGDEPPISVADLLKAKKAGQLMAQSDPSTRGFFTNEIHTKINPLLKELAPEVYNAQQAVHLSKIKEAILQLFPQGKGMMNYFRTISMIGGSLFHGIGALESPIVQTGLTLGAKGAAQALGSPLARVGAGAAINRIGQNEMNRRALQSVGDRLANNQ